MSAPHAAGTLQGSAIEVKQGKAGQTKGQGMGK